MAGDSSHLNLAQTPLSVLCILFVLKRRDFDRVASRGRLDTILRRRAIWSARPRTPSPEIRRNSSTMPKIDMNRARLALVALTICSMSTASLAEEDPTIRIRPLEPSEWNPKLLNKLSSIGRVRLSADEDPKSGGEGIERKRPPSMLKTVAHHPDLVVPLLDFATVISHNGSISPRESELLALRVAWNCRSEFEWGHHVDYALDAGLSREEIARVPLGASAPGWSAIERALLEAADELDARQHVSPVSSVAVGSLSSRDRRWYIQQPSHPSRHLACRY